MRTATATLSLLFAACAAPAPVAPENSAPPPAPAKTQRSASSSPPSTPALEIRLEPVPSPPGTVHVEVLARGSARQLSEWTIEREALPELDISDEQGAIPMRADAIGAAKSRARLTRDARGSVRVRYRVAAGAPSSATRFRADGASFLLLPAAFAATPVDALIRIDPSGFGPEARAASSLGIGTVTRVELSGEALERSTFVAGTLGHAVFDGPEGLDRAAWSGTIAFDPRQVAAEVAGFRSGAREYFASRRSAPFTLLLIGDDRSPGEFAAARRTTSAVVEVGASQPWTGALRLATAQQVLREWIGAELAVLPASASDRFETAWLTDGVNRTVARELLFRFGLLTPEEYRDEIEQLIALHVTSPVLRVKLADLAHHPDRVAAQTAVVVRGALFATLLDARIRENSKNAYSLDDLLRELFSAARTKNGPLPPTAVTTAVTNLLDRETALELETSYLRGDRTITLPAQALGRCFAPRAATYPIFALGFTPTTGTIEELEPGGPAARAGLKRGEMIRNLSFVHGRTDVSVTLEVQRGGEWQRISYAPIAGNARGQGFSRVRGVPDEHCALRVKSS